MCAVSTTKPNWEFETEEPFSLRAAHIGRQAGARRLGASLYELGPGAIGSPYHVHHANEELLVVLSGTPTVRRPDGRHRLAPGDVIAFPPGAEGAHRVENDSDAPARVLIVSTMQFPDVAEHPDSGKVLAITGPPPHSGEFLAFRREDAVPLLEGETDLTPPPRSGEPPDADG
jgi:uncharacterized cupin superfamily protein